MPVARGPIDCPRYPDKWETGESQVLTSRNGFPVNPVEVTAFLLPGDPLTIPIEVTYPVTDELDLELFFLQDISGSFRTYLASFSLLLPQLILAVLRINSRAKWALASFNEVPLEPFGYQDGVTTPPGALYPGPWMWSPEMMIDQQADVTCPLFITPVFTEAGGRNSTQGAFNWKYCLEYAMSSDQTQFQRKFAALSGLSHDNIDFPEPSMDGMYYATQCHAGWGQNSRKLLVVVTDARWQGVRGETCFDNNTDFVTGIEKFGTRTCTINDPSTPMWGDGTYFERENDLNCVLERPTSSTWMQNREPWLNRPITSWTYAPGTSGNRLPGAGESFIDTAHVFDALIATGIVPLIACAQSPGLAILRPEDRLNLWYWEVLIDSWGFGFARELNRNAATNDAGSLAQLILAALTELSE